MQTVGKPADKRRAFFMPKSSYTAVFVPPCWSVNAPTAVCGVSQRERQKSSVFFLPKIVY